MTEIKFQKVQDYIAYLENIGQIEVFVAWNSPDADGEYNFHIATHPEFFRVVVVPELECIAKRNRCGLDTKESPDFRPLGHGIKAFTIVWVEA